MSITTMQASAEPVASVVPSGVRATARHDSVCVLTDHCRFALPASASYRCTFVTAAACSAQISTNHHPVTMHWHALTTKSLPALHRDRFSDMERMSTCPTHSVSREDHPAGLCAPESKSMMAATLPLGAPCVRDSVLMLIRRLTAMLVSNCHQLPYRSTCGLPYEPLHRNPHPAPPGPCGAGARARASVVRTALHVWAACTAADTCTRPLMRPAATSGSDGWSAQSCR